MHPTVHENATDVLRHNHQKLRDLFELFRESDDLSEQKEILESVVRECRLYMQSEEDIFYPAVSEAPYVSHLVEQALEEHQELNAVLEDLHELDVKDPLFMDKFMELKDKTLYHMQQEEAELFPQVEEADLDMKSVADALRQRMQADAAVGTAPVSKRRRKSVR